LKGKEGKTVGRRRRDKPDLDIIIVMTTNVNVGMVSSGAVKSSPNSNLHLHEATRRSNKEEVKRLLGFMSPDVRDASRQTPLHLACHERNFEIIKQLVQKKASLNVQDKSGWTPLHSSANAGDFKSCEYLLRQEGFDATLTNNDGTTVLHYIVRHDVPPKQEDRTTYKSVLNLLIEKGAEVNAQTRHGEAPIHQACLKGNREAVKFLLKHKANVNLANKLSDNCNFFSHSLPILYFLSILSSSILSRIPSLSFTFFFFFFFIFTLFLFPLFLSSTPFHLHLTSISPSFRLGETALHYAVRCLYKNPEVVAVLMKYGANPLLKSKEGTPIDIAPPELVPLLHSGKSSPLLSLLKLLLSLCFYPASSPFPWFPSCSESCQP
jgi:ankyrin repeat protein